MSYRGAEGLAEDVRYYGKWMRDEAEKRIGHLYPKVKGPDGTEHTVIAWIWARTVKSPNPANPIETPLVKSWWLSKKKGKEAWIKPTVENGEVRYEVFYNANGPSKGEDGTRVGRGAVCVADGTPITTEYIKEEGKASGFGNHLIAIICENSRGRLYLSPTKHHSDVAKVLPPESVPQQELSFDPRNIWTPSYGLELFSNLFTNRQLNTITTFISIIPDLLDRIRSNNTKTNSDYDQNTYAQAISTYLALSISRLIDRNSNLCSWDASRESIRNVFSRQAIPMVWDYAESNPFSNSSGNFLGQVNWVAKTLEHSPATKSATSTQISAIEQNYSNTSISTDPPYYDNIGYSNLSDFFYVWLRKMEETIYNSKTTLLTPKLDEMVADPYRHGSKNGAKDFFIKQFNTTFTTIRDQYNTGNPITVYYAYKQQDTEKGSSFSTGWHTLLDGLISSGWEISATWPLRSELSNRMVSKGTNALASSIVLACRPRPEDAPATTRRAFIATLKRELPEALRTLMQGTIAPVDLAQAAIGPGISVFSRYSRVREADGTDMDVRQALQLINATLDEVLGEQESDFDGETRFAVKWYRQYGWAQESSGIADQLARASDTSITGLERGGIFEAKGGKARLLAPTELSEGWDPATDDRVSIWEATVRLAGVMAHEGMEKVAQLLPAVQAKVSLDAVKELGFLLFHEAEKQQMSQDAQLFNSLVTAWGDVTEQSRRLATQSTYAQQTLDVDGH